MELAEDPTRQCFIISKEILNTMSYEDAVKTSTDMKELGLMRPPFKEFSIVYDGNIESFASWSRGSILQSWPNKQKSKLTPKFLYIFDDALKNYDLYMRLGYENSTAVYVGGEDLVDNAIWQYNAKYKDYIDEETYVEKYIESVDAFSKNLLAVLFVLLATKNIVKDVRSPLKIHSKSRKRQRVDSDKYITTLKIGSIIETYRSNNSTGSAVRPHLRRGHIRSQHFGIGNKEIKKIFIQPVFVNADDGWIANERKAYKVTL